MKKCTQPSDEQLLSKKAESLKNFIEDCIARNSNTANDVFLKLYGTDFKVPADPKQSIASDILSGAYSLLPNLEFEGSEVVGWIIGGIINKYKETNDTDPQNLPQLLAQDASDINERIIRTLTQTYQDLAEIQQDPLKHWNDTYDIPFGEKKTVIVNELLNYDIPDVESRPVDYGNMLISFREGLTYQVAKTEIVSRKLYKIGYPVVINLIVGTFQSLIVNPEHCQPGHEDADWTPLLSPKMVWKLEQSDTSNGNTIINRCPKENGGPAEIFHPYGSKSNPCNEDDWKKSAGEYMSTICKSSFLSRYSIFTDDSGNKVLAWRTFYLIDSRYNYEQESAYGTPTWYVVPDDFCNWLFKDDGFGNIVNPTGIATREDVFVNWGLEGSKGVLPPAPNSKLGFISKLKRLIWRKVKLPLINIANGLLCN
jgi:hypothetical protein